MEGTVTAVAVRELAYAYPPARRGALPRAALRGVTFSVASGELFGVLGPNGGGKTTLFRILSTALRPTSGEGSLLGLDLSRDPGRVREKIGVVFQSPSLDKKLTVLENLGHQGRLYGLSGAGLRRRAQCLMEKVGLADRAGDRVEHLSGGLQRRVEIAKSLLHGPELLLLDEPTTGLDPGARKDLWTYLAALAKDGVTVLITTHLMEEAERCDRLAILDQGRLAALGTPTALKAAIRGDVVGISTANPAGLAQGIRRAFGLEVVVLEGAIRLEREEGHRFVPQLVEAFPGLVQAVTVGKPTLEDVFVHHTGHRFWSQHL